VFGLIALIGGILLRVNPEWFHGASTIGLVLIIAGALWGTVEFLIYAKALSIFNSASKEIKRNRW